MFSPSRILRDSTIQRHKGVHPPTRSRRYGPCAEVLEGRCVPSTFDWTGAKSSVWANPANWVRIKDTGNGSTFPGEKPEDVAIFDPAKVKATPDVRLGADRTLYELDILAKYPGTITLANKNGDAKHLTISRFYTQKGGTIAGSGNLYLGATFPGAPNSLCDATISVPAKLGGGGNVIVRSGSILQIIGDPQLPSNAAVTFDRRNVSVESAGNPPILDPAAIFLVDRADIQLINATINNSGYFTTYENVTFRVGDRKGLPPSQFDNNTGATFYVALARPAFDSTQVQVPFNNQGSVDIADGRLLYLIGGGTSSGTFFQYPGAILSFITPTGSQAKYTWNNGTSFTGTADENGNILSKELHVYANVSINGQVDLAETNFSFAGGQISGPGTLFVDDSSQFYWSQGVADNVVIEVTPSNLQLGHRGGALYLGDGGTLQNRARIVNYNVANLQNGTFTLKTNAGIVNGSTGNFDIQSKDNSSIVGDGSTTFVNQGRVTKLRSSTGKTTIDKTSFTNTGVVKVRGGILKIPKDVQKKEALTPATTEDGGKLDTDGLLQLEAGVLENVGDSALVGEVFGDVLNTGGEVDPGGAGATGILTIDGTNGTYTQSGQGVLNIDLANPTPGTGADQLVVTGDIQLGGVLKVNTLPGFTGDSFTILKDDGPQPVHGQFDGLPEGAGLTLAGRAFTITYHGGAGKNDVVLNAVTPVELTPGPLNIPSDGSVVHTGLILPAGTPYTLVVSGSVGITDPNLSGGVTFQCDAEYEWDPGTNLPIQSADHGVDLGVNATTDDGSGFTDIDWGPYNPTHQYQVTLISDGKPLDFKFFDTYYPDNHPGNLSVDVFAAVPLASVVKAATPRGQA
jgi:hypothetical protein